jgi:hypothetical protein
MLDVSMVHVGTMFQADRDHVIGIFGEVTELVGRQSVFLLYN